MERECASEQTFCKDPNKYKAFWKQGEAGEKKKDNYSELLTHIVLI